MLFSSVAAVVGNPGQGAYVAANGFLEGLARERHSAGLPALAIAWGGIADVGVLARHGATRDALTNRVGVKGIKAQAALDLMAQALSVDGGPAGDGVIVIADMNWPAARAHLPVLKSPTYSRLGSDDKAADAPPEGAIDLRELSMRLGPDQARRAVADVLVEEIAKSASPAGGRERTKLLTEIGLNSLMEVELMLSVKSQFALDSPARKFCGRISILRISPDICCR